MRVIVAQIGTDPHQNCLPAVHTTLPFPVSFSILPSFVHEPNTLKSKPK